MVPSQLDSRLTHLSPDSCPGLVFHVLSFRVGKPLMASETLVHHQGGPITAVGRMTLRSISAVGDLAVFSFQMLGALFTGLPRRSVLLPVFYQVGVHSIPVVLITGTFIGMVLAVQTYDQFRQVKLEDRLGAVINVTLVKELGPVLAAVMLAGRVGSSIAAELGTMKVTEQIEALKALGANPIRYLVVPRFLACFMLIPLLTSLADIFGILGGWLFSTQVLGINSFQYWLHTNNYVTVYDLMTGIFKSFFFGGAIALIACHRGFHSGAGAEGVGRAATESFVLSFIVILIIDFLLGFMLSKLYYMIWDAPVSFV